MSPRQLKTMLRQIREERGISQFELAQKSGVPQGYLSELEAGKKKNPGLDVLKRLARALDISVGELIE